MKDRFSKLLLLLFLSSIGPASQGQHAYRDPQASNDILHDLELAQKAGRVLYLAAHPDDENTQVISHLSRQEHIRTAYLSLTRGGGGQNLIGPERGELLSVLRTQELLQARRIDGGEQYFSRAKDFGYSKTAKETFEKWGKEETLSDVVRVIRRFKPDVIITRFPSDGYEGGHGHHTASAILAEEAFERAADPEAFPDQLDKLEPWQSQRLLYNTSTWWDEELPEKVDEEQDLFRVNVGKYDPYTGLSYTEIAAEARSMHKCQGFGVVKERGRTFEYFRLLKDRSDLEGTPSSIMDGLSSDPGRYEGGQKVAEQLRKAREEFDPARPEKIVPTLIEAFRALERVEDTRWRASQKEHLKQLIMACSGSYMEASTNASSASPGDSFKVRIEFTHRSEVPVQIGQVELAALDTNWNLTPEENEASILELRAKVPEDIEPSTHHWLEGKAGTGTYDTSGDHTASLIEAEASPALSVKIDCQVKNESLKIELPIEHKERSRVRGEVYEPFRVLPSVTANGPGKAQVFPEARSREVEVSYRAHRKGIEAEASLDLPEGWSMKPDSKKIHFDQKGETQEVRFQVIPPSEPSKGEMIPYAKRKGQRYQKREDRVEYRHITPQTVLKRSGSRVVQLGVGKREARIGYIMGSGDEVPDALRQLGYSVDILEAGRLSKLDLQRYDMLITGIRAFNVKEALRFKKQELFQYAERGGHLLIQYNKDEEALVTPKITPYELTPSHERVTEENAEAKLLEPDHAVFNEPNDIDGDDFEGWVQERGLYFADEWDERFTPLISWHDEGESPKKGGLLIAEHGEGSIAYTGIAFFRQLPAGVPGAYRLFDNLVQYGIDAGGP